MIGKFENEEALLKSYGDLEKEFTKKCQELSRVKKELEAKNLEAQVENGVEGETLEVANDAVEEISEVGDLCESEKIVDGVENFEDVVKIEPEMIDVAVAQDVKASEDEKISMDNLRFRLKANEFLISNADAKEYACDIAKVLLKDKSLMACSDPFGVAYALVLKEKQGKTKSEVVEAKSVVNIPDKKQNELSKTGSTITLMGKNIATFSPPRVAQKYRTMDDARAELLRRFS